MRVPYRVKLIGCIASLSAILLAGNAHGAQSETHVRKIFRVMLDEARLLRLDTAAQTLVIGNPAIADAVVNDGKTIIITGKAFGTTNLIALNRSNEIIAERQIEVQEPDSSILSVQRGAKKESYSCTPKCRPTPILGDDQDFVSGIIGQSGSRNGWAQGSGGGGK